jgi:hypothetical protein
MTRSPSWAATADRLEMIINTLTTCTVAETVTIARGAAVRAVTYCRSRAAGGKEDMDAEREMDEFIHAHGQSLDWIYRGDPTNMIIDLAAGTSSHKPPRLRVI